MPVDPTVIRLFRIFRVARFVRLARAVPGSRAAAAPRPNLVRQRVFTESQDARAPCLALFASEDIPAGVELLR